MILYFALTVLSLNFIRAAQSELHLQCNELLPDPGGNKSSEPFCLIAEYPRNSSVPEFGVRFPSYSKIYLVDFNVSYLSAEFLSSMTAVKELIIYISTVPRVYLVPDLKSVAILVSGLQQLVIETNHDYQLRMLNVSHNKLTELPRNINHLLELELLNLSDNLIAKFNLSDLSGLTNLRSVSLEGNNITTISSDLVNLPSLIQLDLSRNLLERVPSRLDFLPSLEEFYLNKNKLEFIEMSAFNGMMQLKFLDLSDNIIQIGSISRVVLPSLEILKFKNCALSELDMFRWKLPKLQQFHLQGNRLEYIGNLDVEPVQPVTLYGSGNRWSCAWMQKILPSSRISFVGQQDYRPCSRYIAKVCCFESEYQQDVRVDSRMHAVKNQNRQIYAELGSQRDELALFQARVGRIERRLEEIVVLLYDVLARV